MRERQVGIVNCDELMIDSVSLVFVLQVGDSFSVVGHEFAVMAETSCKTCHQVKPKITVSMNKI